jgi:hypothetical protein
LTGAFVAAARELKVTPHVAQNINAHRGSNIDARTTRHPGYQISQVIRKRIEEANGWIKTVAGMVQTKFRGLARVGWMVQFRPQLTTSSGCLDCWRQDESVRSTPQGNSSDAGVSENPPHSPEEARNPRFRSKNPSTIWLLLQPARGEPGAGQHDRIEFRHGASHGRMR